MAGPKKPLHLFVGRTNTPKAENSSAATLERALKDSLGEIVANLQEFINHMNGVTPDLLVEALEPTFGKSLEQVPVDSGDLKASAYLEAEPFRGGARAVMGYGRGNNPDYAVFVHEMTEYKHAGDTKAKYLQDPLDEDYYQIINSLPRLVNEYAGMA